MKNKDIVPAYNDAILRPGDKMSQEMMPGGDIITRLNTKDKKATGRQYMKKDGTPGKRTVILMEPDE